MQENKIEDNEKRQTCPFQKNRLFPYEGYSLFLYAEIRMPLAEWLVGTAVSPVIGVGIGINDFI